MTMQEKREKLTRPSYPVLVTGPVMSDFPNKQPPPKF